MECYFRVQRMPASRLPKQVFCAEWKRPGGAVVLTGRQKYASMVWMSVLHLDQLESARHILAHPAAGVTDVR
jgi:hypothetical protein